MCKSCGQLHIYERFRSMSQYAHEISKIRGFADWGDIEVEYAAIPLCEIDGGFRGMSSGACTAAQDLQSGWILRRERTARLFPAGFALLTEL